MDWRRSEHEYEPKPPLLQGLPKALGDLRSVFHAVEVSQLVRLIQHEHLETIARDGIEIQSRRVIGRNYGAWLLRISFDQGIADRNLSGDIEFRKHFLPPLRTKQLGTDDQNLGKTRARNQLADD